MRAQLAAEQRPKVVYVEDQPDMIYLVRLILERNGIELIAAANGHDGLKTIQRVKPDLVLLDLMMPQMDGWTLIRRMKADHALSKIPVIIFSVRAEPKDLQKGLEVFGAADYVTKPFDVHRLLRSVNRVLGRQVVT